MIVESNDAIVLIDFNHLNVILPFSLAQDIRLILGQLAGAGL